MGLTEDRIKDFEQRKAKLETLGGEKLVAKQHQLGKLTARERIDLFFDKGTFQETQLFVKHRSKLFGLDKKEINADGVITGFGDVNGRTVFAAAQVGHDYHFSVFIQGMVYRRQRLPDPGVVGDLALLVHWDVIVKPEKDPFTPQIHLVDIFH